jgi:hypothetical protein
MLTLSCVNVPFCTLMFTVEATDMRVGLLLAAVAGICLAVWVLLVIWQRERVKTDLRSRCMRPLSVRWHPFAPGWTSHCGFGTGFRVVYVDYLDVRHRAYCWIWELPIRVRWTKDEVIGEESSDSAT